MSAHLKAGGGGGVQGVNADLGAGRKPSVQGGLAVEHLRAGVGDQAFRD